MGIGSEIKKCFFPWQQARAFSFVVVHASGENRGERHAGRKTREAVTHSGFPIAAAALLLFFPWWRFHIFFPGLLFLPLPR